MRLGPKDKRIRELERQIDYAHREINALRVKPWQEQIEGQAAEISRLRYELCEALRAGVCKCQQKQENNDTPVNALNADTKT